MKSIEAVYVKAENALVESGMSREKVSAITEGIPTLEQRVLKLKAFIDAKLNPIRRKNGLGACKESFEPSTQRLLEVLKRNGYSDQESWVMAGLKGNPITEADIKEIPTGQETLYETLRQSYGHKEALLMMVD
jgi:hypothetical protein